MPETARATPLGHPFRRAALILTAALASFLLLILCDGLFTRLPSLAAVPAPGERIGILHVHTNASCGSGSLTQVIDTAKQADLSFLAVTDHNLAMSQAAVAAVDPPDFAVIDGEEVSTSTGHFLALGLSDTWPRGTSYDARTLMASTRAAGAVNFIAHPFGLRDRWHVWDTPDYDGMEIWNDDAVWRQNTVLDILISTLLYPVNSRLALVHLARTPRENLAKWDELEQTRHVAGICGSDAHAALLVNNRMVARFPSYSSVFGLIRQHVLLDKNTDPDHAGADVILNALKQGNSFCALDGLAPAAGFTQTVSSQLTPSSAITGSQSSNSSDEHSQTAGPGDSIAFTSGLTLHVAVPSGTPAATLRVLRDGREIAKQQSQSLDLPLPGPGHYRTEAYLREPGLTGFGRWTLWVFANPVTVTSGQLSK